MSKRIALLSSTGGAVAQELMSQSSLRFDYVFTDRVCKAEDVAARYDIPVLRIEESDGERFSDKLGEALIDNSIDYVMIFFSRLLKGSLLTDFRRKLINFHPSLLPACPGMKGFEDSLKSGAIVVGSTVHFVDDGVDTGTQIMQAYCSSPGKEAAFLRHTVFAQQVACLYDIFHAIKDGEFDMGTSGNIVLTKRSYEMGGISCPTLSGSGRRVYENVLGKYKIRYVEE